MKKFYFSLFLSVAVITAFSQETKVQQNVKIPLFTQNFEGVTESQFIPVQKDALFTIEGNFTVPAKKSFITKLLKATGIAASSYQGEIIAQQFTGTKAAYMHNNKSLLLPILIW